MSVSKAYEGSSLARRDAPFNVSRRLVGWLVPTMHGVLKVRH